MPQYINDPELLAQLEGTPRTRTPQDFAKVYGPAAERAGKALGVDPSMLLGQWGLETGWGKSIIPGTNNLGNIKDFAGGGVQATDNMTGSRDKYRAYESPEAFADDFASLIQRKYPNAVGAKDPLAFATALKSSGYAEDPRYVDKVVQASRMAGTTQNPVMKEVGSAMEAVVPSAQAAPAYGNRPDGTPKGSGFFGELKRPDGNVSTEISVGVNIGGKEMDIPTLVPTLTRAEVDQLLSLKEGEPPPEAIVRKAADFAKQRLAKGQSVFAGQNERAQMPTAQAADRQYIQDPELLAQLEDKPAQKAEGKSMLKTATEAVTRVLPGGTIINAIKGPGVDRDALKGFASGMADVGSTIINQGTKGAAALPDNLRLTPRADSDAMNADRQAGLQHYNAENTSPAFTGGRIAGNVAATIPAGNVAGAGIAAAGLPRLGAALASGGMSTGAKVAPGFVPGAVDLGIRTLGGAASGGMTAGLVNPDSAGQGAMIGAALPGIVKGLGMAGDKVGQVLRGPEAQPSTLAAATAGREAGYVIPPTQVKPTLTNRLLEGFSGKITTAQNASARNQGVTNELAKKAINAQELTPEGLQAVRAQANKAYDVLGQSAPFQADDAFRASLEKAGASSKQLKADFPELVNKDVDSLVEGLAGRAEFDAQSTIEAVKRLRASASANRISTDPEKKALGQVQSKVSAALEDLIERNLQTQGAPEVLEAYRAARQTLAKTYDIEKAMNPASGNVDANKLAQLLKKGRPLTGDLRTIAEFSSAFPKATQTVERMGSLPQTSPLDWAAMGLGSAATGNPLMMAGVLARPAARSAVLSPMVQNRLTQPNRLMQLTSEDLNLLAPLVRAAPLSATSR